MRDNVQKYRRDKLFVKMRWAMFGQKDSQKLRQSLEDYKTVVSLGLHNIRKLPTSR